MNKNEWIEKWKMEEEIAYIHGWDFSHIEGRYTEDTDFPWDYRQVIGEYLTPDMKLLDIDTGGGEFLRSLEHPHKNTAATENYPPNVQLCRQTLLPLGIDFRQADGKGELPFADENSVYTLENADTGDEMTVPGATLLEGIVLTLPKPRSCLMYRIKRT